MAIETTPSSVSPSSPSVFETQAQRPRPLDVGILGIEMYFPQRVIHSFYSYLSLLF
jgi:hydroxymethylglutaryl-CoA synthase